MLGEMFEINNTMILILHQYNSNEKLTFQIMGDLFYDYDI